MSNLTFRDMENVKLNTLSKLWKKFHLTIFYGSAIVAALLLIVLLFISRPPAELLIGKQMLIYGGIYAALLGLMAALYYAFFYLPNYFFYKRMIREGHEKEIMLMVEKHGFNRLVTKRWFMLRDKAGLSDEAEKGSE